MLGHTPAVGQLLGRSGCSAILSRSRGTALIGWCVWVCECGWVGSLCIVQLIACMCDFTFHFLFAVTGSFTLEQKPILWMSELCSS